MNERDEEFQQAYEKGKLALERGRYEISIQELEKAKKRVNPQSKLGGEVRIWLVSAYQAGNKTESAIALCQSLSKHPSPEIRKQSERILYILQAPVLKRPEEWLTKIPDLSQISEDQGTITNSRPAGAVKPRRPRKLPEPEPIDPSEIKTKDNQFIWVALLMILASFFLLISF
ncbi:MAG: outer membrane protein assembly factor BamD [Halothece sp.]